MSYLYKKHKDTRNYYLLTINFIKLLLELSIVFYETRAKQPLLLTLQHWSGLSPYTSSYELAGTCVFDKQSLEKRLLRPFFFQRKADLIPKLRSLFCRVPSGSFTCSP